MSGDPHCGRCNMQYCHQCGCWHEFPRPICCPVCPLGPEGPQGPAGPQGPQGETGPTGPAGPGALGGVQAQLSGAAQEILEEGGRVLFSELISGSGISYDSQSGEFLLPGGGSYLVTWWVAVNGTEAVPAVEFAVALGGVPVAAACSPLVTCQLSGAALIAADPGPRALTLVNRSGAPIRYAATSLQAGIVIAGTAG